MEPTQMILLVIAAAFAIWIFTKIVGAIFKVLLFAAFLILGYIFFFGGSIEDVIEPGLEQMFKNNTIDELMVKHCDPEKLDALRCECIVMPVYKDLHKRFNAEQLEELDKNQERMTQEALKSFSNTKETMKTCATDKLIVLIKIFNTFKNIIKGFMSED